MMLAEAKCSTGFTTQHSTFTMAHCSYNNIAEAANQKLPQKHLISQATTNTDLSFKGRMSKCQNKLFAPLVEILEILNVANLKPSKQ